MNELVVTTPPEAHAQEVADRIAYLVNMATGAFLELGALFYQANVECHWSILHFESWNEYLEDFHLPVDKSYSWVRNLIGIYEEFRLKRAKPVEELQERGYTRVLRVLPLARQGKLTDELWQAARDMRDIDLRREIGHHIPEAEECWITCYRCGAQQWGYKPATKKREQDTKHGKAD